MGGKLERVIAAEREGGNRKEGVKKKKRAARDHAKAVRKTSRHREVKSWLRRLRKKEKG